MVGVIIAENEFIGICRFVVCFFVLVYVINLELVVV